ncbi:MAG: hypothetical protein HC920_12280 [Oscillatoriales cyanobacterium SM2_3_0]|nr:hypothetical protein [Oscillatoriales cyanobacterium SM2_3_0]
MKTVLTLNSTLQDLTLHIADLDATVSTQAIAQLFETSHQVPGVILKHDDEFLGMISRRRYFEFMSRPYSLDLFLGRPIQIFYQVAQVEFLTLTSQTPITTAIKNYLTSPEN